MPRINKDLIGEKFTRLMVVAEYSKCPKTRRLLWKCICDCGNEVIAKTNELTTGNTKSCGCLKRDNLRRQLHDVHENNRTVEEFLAWIERVYRHNS